ncbi:MAG: penicillin-binding protein 2 [Anaerolineae bacterium]|nr:penicillin-binding protein 2 [Anaerolineae bacterium]
MNDESLSRRLTLLGVVLIGISLVLMGKLVWFQYQMDPKTKATLEENRENRLFQKVEVQPDRGLIFDRNGHLLATNSFDYQVGISPNMVLDRQQVAAQLAPLVGLPEDQIYHALEPDENGVYSSWVLLASRVDFATGQAIADLDITGIDLDPRPIRVYPQGKLTAQLVGLFAGAEDIKNSRGYYGVEGFYDTLLAGQSKRVTTSTIPLLEESETNTDVRDGISLVLTIDRDLQNLAQEVLNDAIESDQTATGGTILIMNPRNGEILAIANYPQFDPDDAEGSDLDLAKNQAVQDFYEPGSIFKVLTMAVALDLGTHDLSWTYHDPGCMEGRGNIICNWDDRSRGDPDFAQVFIESLNTGTATIFEQIGPTQVYPKLRDFGIGTPTGVDLEGETRGILNQPGDLIWSENQFLTTSFGQGVAVSPIQMLTAVNAIANDGLIMQPHIVKARIDGNEVIEATPSASHRPISEEAAHTARDIMVRVLQENQDIEFDFPGYTIAGKTGTAEIPMPGGYEPFQAGNTIASFVGFLPADDPVVSVLVKLDRPQDYWGSKTAAPVFETLLRRLVVLMEIPPDNLRYTLVAEGGNPFGREY